MGLFFALLSANCSAGNSPGELGSEDEGGRTLPDGTTLGTTGTPDAATSVPDGPAVPEASANDAVVGAGEGSSCPTMCNDACVDVTTDPKNCGACGHVCATGQACTGSTCGACPDNQVVCPSNNSCADTTSDESNCGACGHNCQGSTCSNSLCVPSAITQAMNAVIEDIVVDQSGTNVYWTLGGENGGVFKKPFAGGNATEISVPNGSDDDPRGLAVDTNNVYWVDYGSDAVGTVSLFGGSSSYPVPPITAGAPTNEPIAIAVDPSNPTNIYWVDYLLGTVNQMAIVGGAFTQLASERDHPFAIAVDSTSVYWVDRGSQPGNGSVNKVPIGGTTVTPLATGQTQPWDLTVDSTYVYWTSQGNPGSVQAVPIGGGSAILIAMNQGAPSGIVVDPPATTEYPSPPQFIFWTNFNDNNVMRAPIPGATDAGAPGTGVTEIASNQNTPAAMAIDHKNVYWANQGSGTILEVAK